MRKARSKTKQEAKNIQPRGTQGVTGIDQGAKCQRHTGTEFKIKINCKICPRTIWGRKSQKQIDQKTE